MKAILFIIFQLLVLLVHSQVLITGSVETKQGQPVAGANVYLRGTYDGGTSDSLGRFGFQTHNTGKQTMIVSYIGFEPQALEIDLEEGNSKIRILLIESVSDLHEVVINSGSFEASDRNKSVMLRPLDIALTGGANSDSFGAFGTLPGSHTIPMPGILNLPYYPLP